MYEEVKQIQRREREALRRALRRYGTPTKDGGYEFLLNDNSEENDNYIAIAAYSKSTGRPYDYVICKASMDKDERLSLEAREIEDGWDMEDVDVEGNDVFAGQLTFLTDEITMRGKHTSQE